MRCPSCERENPEDAAFCSGCGSRVARLCHSCGRSNHPENSFCNKCGQRLGDEAELTHTTEKVPTSPSPLEADASSR